nr:PEF-CTERM sorting domain-containing protein [uncultured Methanolobus sp.]
MKKSIIFALSLLIILAGVASACQDCNSGCDCNGELICFENMKCGEPITTQFADQGAIFGTAVVSYKDMSGSGTAYSTEQVTITFDPEVCCVSMEVNSVYGVQIIAYDKNGNVVDTANGGSFFCPRLVELSAGEGNPISYITLTASSLEDLCYPRTRYVSTMCCTYDDWLCIDNLKFCTCQDNEIPEFPTLAIPVLAIMGLALIMQRRR